MVIRRTLLPPVQDLAGSVSEPAKRRHGAQYFLRSSDTPKKVGSFLPGINALCGYHLVRIAVPDSRYGTFKVSRVVIA